MNKSVEKTKLVDSVFSSIYKKYDLMNDVISLGSHRIIKRKAMNKCKYGIGSNLLDLAAGTGDLALYYRKRDIHKNNIVLCDPNSEMLSYAKTRLKTKVITENIEIVNAYAEELPFDDNYFDNISIGFGFRNFTDKVKALDEIKRVMRKGARLLIIDFSKPTNPIIAKLNSIYLNRIVPPVAKIFTGNNSEYKYLATSIAEHPSQRSIIEMMGKTGFTNCEYSNKLNGIIAVHTATKN